MSSEERIVAARLWAAYNYPYLASALFAMRFISDETVGGVAGDEHFRIYVDHAETRAWEVEIYRKSQNDFQTPPAPSS